MGTIALPPGEHTLDARAIVHGAQSRCARQRALLAAGYRLGDVAEALYAIPRARQSRLTLALGVTFERQVFEGNAERLIEAYKRFGYFGQAEPRIADYRRGHKHEAIVGNVKSHTQDRLAGKRSPEVILGAVIDASLLGLPGAYVKPDVLIADTESTFYRAGEVKSYESREGLTADEDIESSAAQAAVSLALLQMQQVEYRKLQDVHLILRRPSSMFPIVHAVPAMRDLEAIWAFAVFIAESQTAALPPPPGPLTADLIESIPNAYSPLCLQSCDLAKACRHRAFASADPSLLGPAAEELFKPVCKLIPLATMVKGTGHDCERLRAGQRALREVVAS